MGIFTSIIGALAGPLVTNVVGGIFGLGEKDEGKDGKPRLVARPEPPSGKERRQGFSDWARDNSVRDPNSRSGSTARAVSATKGVSPSQMEANYWSAIFADAKRKSEVG